MAGLEIAAIKLASVVVKSACMLWVGDREAAAEASASLIDLFQGRVSSHLQERQLERLFDECADIVAGRLMRLLEHEFVNLPENERSAAIIAVHDTFARAGLTDKSLFRADLDPRLLEKYLGPYANAVLKSALLSDGAEQLFAFVMREACAYLVEVIATLPGFQASGIKEILGRQTALLERLQDVLERMPERRGIHDFTTDYRRQVAVVLDRMELYGVRLHEASRNYPLSVAYLNLSASSPADSQLTTISHDIRPTGDASVRPSFSGQQRVDEVIAGASRTLLVGEAGSGKSTLLRWLAVRSARGELSGALAKWKGVIPFFVPLRSFVSRPLPRPEQFVETVSRSIAAEMPSGWVQRTLRSGEALVLIDGVDELPGPQRGPARLWLNELLVAFPDSRYVVTSRPEAITKDWLDYLGFWTTELHPMSPPDVREFVAHWHQAVAESIADPRQRGEFRRYEWAMIQALESDRHLRRLAISPLLCALLCALNREMLTRLPRSRMEVYDAALGMLLEQRDRERGVEATDVDLTRTERALLLEDLALWLIRNGRSRASSNEVIAQFGGALRGLRRTANQPDPAIVFRHLLERSGVLREPVVGGVDFIHRTFQEYMAGKAAVDDNAIGELVRNAHDDQWREVVIMAAGHAQPHQCAELLKGLLSQAKDDNQLHMLALACLQNGRQVVPELRERVEQSARSLMPPRSRTMAEALASAGDFVLDLLPTPMDAEEAEGIVTTAMHIGGDDALRLIARIAEDQRWQASLEDLFIRAMDYFAPGVYAATVLAKLDLSNTVLSLRGNDISSVLAHLSSLYGIRFSPTTASGKQLRELPQSPDVKGLALTWASESYPPARETVDAERWLARVADYDEEISNIRRIKEEKIDEQDFEAAAAARDMEKIIISLKDWNDVLEGALSIAFLNITQLMLENAPLRDLVQVEIPSRVRSLTLSSWPNVCRLNGLETSQGLEHLQLQACGPADTMDLSALTALLELRSVFLDLGSSFVPDLSQLSQLPRLHDIVIGSCACVDLRPFARRTSRSGQLAVHLVRDQTVTGLEIVNGSVDIVHDAEAWTTGSMTGYFAHSYEA